MPFFVLFFTRDAYLISQLPGLFVIDYRLYSKELNKDNRIFRMPGIDALYAEGQHPGYRQVRQRPEERICWK